MDTLQLIAVGVTVAVNLYFAFIVFLKDRKSETNVYFSLLLVGIAFWAISNFMYNRSDLAYDQVVFWMRMVFVITTPFIYLMLNFSFSFPKRNSTLPLIWKIVFTIPMLLIFVFSFGDQIVSGANTKGTITPVFGDGIKIYFVYALAYIGLALFILIKKYRSAVGIQRSQIQYLFLGFSLFTVPALFTNLILVVLFNNVSLASFGPGFSLFLAFFISYSILKHKLFDIYYLSAVFLINIAISAFVYMIFYAVIFIDIFFFNNLFNIGTYLLNVVFAIAFCAVIFRIKDKIENIVKLNIKSISNLNVVLTRITLIADNTSVFEELGEKITKTMNENLNINDVSIVIPQENVRDANLLNISQNDFFNANIKKVLEEFENPSILLEKIKLPYLKVEWENDFRRISSSNDANRLIDKIFAETKAQLLLPIITNNITIGIFIIGSKVNEQAYTIQDMDFFGKVSRVMAIPLERSILLREASQFNKTLQRKVDDATSELMEQKNKIQNQYQEEKDMMGIIGHELRTPLTIAKGNLEYILKKLEPMEIPQKEMVTQKIKDSFESVRRESELVQTMLSTSHVDRNKIDLHPEPTNIVDVAKQSVSDFKSDAEHKNLKLSFEDPKEEVSLVFADPLRMTEVTNNLISNAVKYTDTGTVDVFITQDTDFVYVNVKDTGRGISETDMKNIGQKFFRVENYLNESKSLVRPGGTGLGIYVVKGLLTASGGELIINSKLGEGSTFTAKIPRSKDQTVEAEPRAKNEQENVDMFIQMGLKKSSDQDGKPAEQSAAAKPA